MFAVVAQPWQKMDLRIWKLTFMKDFYPGAPYSQRNIKLSFTSN
jgi:hypothetical protein